MTLTGRVDGGKYSYEAGRRAALEIAAKNNTDATFFANDILAIGGVDALREDAGKRVPEDISVAGFDDIPMASWPHYALTTSRRPLDEIVTVVVGMLEDSSCRPGKPSSVKRVSGGLIARQWTAPLR
ncbi:substrate-binding domain-containing protein [Rhizobium calliandrae]